MLDYERSTVEALSIKIEAKWKHRVSAAFLYFSSVQSCIRLFGILQIKFHVGNLKMGGPQLKLGFFFMKTSFIAPGYIMGWLRVRCITPGGASKWPVGALFSPELIEGLKVCSCMDSISAITDLGQQLDVHPGKGWPHYRWPTGACCNHVDRVPMLPLPSLIN